MLIREPAQSFYIGSSVKPQIKMLHFCDVTLTNWVQCQLTDNTQSLTVRKTTDPIQHSNRELAPKVAVKV